RTAVSGAAQRNRATTITWDRRSSPPRRTMRAMQSTTRQEEKFNEGHAEARQHHHRQGVRGIHRRGTSRDERARPRAEGGRAPRPARGQGGRGKRRAREDRRDARTGSRPGRAPACHHQASAPTLSPRTWYGHSAYAKDGKIVCFFQPAQKFKTRYATLGFNDTAHLDDGAMWPIAFALTELTAADEARIAALVKQAVS